MQSPRTTGITFINAQLADGSITAVRIAGSRIAALAAPAEPCDAIVDLEGARMFPGLINAHDHLQLNSMPRDESIERYRHVRDWISDIDSRRRFDPQFKASVAVARDQRLLIGGVKNLLSGVTTVAHHDPLYPSLSDPGYPTGVVQDYGWSHSLYIDGEESVRSSYRSTAAQIPWIIHAAEGVDGEARGEFKRLDALACLGHNTLIVHGIALDGAQRLQLERAGSGLIWCPSSNLKLFGTTAQVADLAERGRVALGTDSRLSGARDLLEELCLAAEIGGLDESLVESLVTSASARLLRLSDRGALRVGARADILVLPAHKRLGTATRADVRLVMIEGIVRYGDEDCVRCIRAAADWVQVRVDGRPKVLDGGIAARLLQASASEAGLELPAVAWRAA